MEQGRPVMDIIHSIVFVNSGSDEDPLPTAIIEGEEVKTGQKVKCELHGKYAENLAAMLEDILNLPAHEQERYYRETSEVWNRMFPEGA